MIKEDNKRADKSKKKIAIFHNYMDNIGGAEYVDLILAKALNADIYTTNIDKEKIKKMGFSTDNIYSIGKTPINAPFKQEISYWRFRLLKLKKKYDFYIIAGDWAMSAAVHHKPNLWYIYSPIREIWDAYEYTKNNIIPKSFKIPFSIWAKFHRYLNRIDLKHVNHPVAISKNVQKRVKEFLKADVPVIYSPVETKKYHYKKSKGYWLSVNRLFKHKRVDMQIKAFQKMPEEKLIIVGSYEKSRHFLEYANYIKKIKPENVEIISWASDKELIDLYANCKGFITTSMNEDLGLTVIEAMASGKPVIAPNEGGYKETVIDDETGILIDNINEDKIIRAVKKLGKNPEKYKKACLKRAKIFDTSIFIKKMKEVIENAKNQK